MNEQDFARHARHLLLAWIALIVLMCASLGSAYVALGAGNAVASFGIAIAKSAIVVALFMRLARGSVAVRIVAAMGLAMWLVLAGLSGVDYATRASHPAAYQQPRQLPAPGVTVRP
ncbi:MAG TPA: Caa(3)-type oxidase subunit IV [Ramlibacter sp.]|uniref:Caa(3)-type oxidase subunit IV n=1 Tax=Ramlibacter sp. TaxID=1917967 RepID=UPI002CE13723|nr:Caa(3)-type oxidase subunit IV [Ramlibacter sp.]HVZ46315.1 Caa(3)-type oxidase subunit IV [Ramlibacter sp.]